MEYRKFVMPAIVLAGSIIAGVSTPRIFNSRHTHASDDAKYSQGAPQAAHEIERVLYDRTRSHEWQVYNLPASVHEIKSVLFNRTRSHESTLSELSKLRDAYGADEFARAAMKAIPNMPRLPSSNVSEALILSLFTSAVGERDKQLTQNPSSYDPNNPFDYAAMASRHGGIKVGAVSYAPTRVPDIYRNLETGKFERRDGKRMVEYAVPFHNGRAVDVDDPRVDVANNVAWEDTSSVQHGYEVRTSVPGGESATVYQSKNDYLQKVTAERVANDPVAQAAQRANDAAIHAGRAVDNFLKSLDNGKKR